MTLIKNEEFIKAAVLDLRQQINWSYWFTSSICVFEWWRHSFISVFVPVVLTDKLLHLYETLQQTLGPEQCKVIISVTMKKLNS